MYYFPVWLSNTASQHRRSRSPMTTQQSISPANLAFETLNWIQSSIVIVFNYTSTAPLTSSLWAFTRNYSICSIKRNNKHLTFLSLAASSLHCILIFSFSFTAVGIWEGEWEKSTDCTPAYSIRPPIYTKKGISCLLNRVSVSLARNFEPVKLGWRTSLHQTRTT